MTDAHPESHGPRQHLSTLMLGALGVVYGDIACIGLVLGFRSSSSLAAAYGIAVTAIMVMTSILLYPVARERWSWSVLSAGLLIALFLSVNLAFFGGLA